eukprot:TRINITY_DN3554_c0_g1_i10.p1 TRINITY_DN3554_c0_g1~~TRINITY_DN3554_c0_g1_i10.p1  ORF type:complete len:782 (+),score=347.19 TRINITY_DN3554_c0_g1_i10:50-2395(+)
MAKGSPPKKKAAATAAAKGGKDAGGWEAVDIPSTGRPIWFNPIVWALRLYFVQWALREAYHIRTYAIQEYGTVIHEFDPWFNFRATQYLADNGVERFYKWFDYMSWYPLGRPVGTTIYPGMQLTSVAIWNALPSFGVEMSLNDVCCYMPVWFGVIATVFLGLLAYECSGSIDVGVISAGIFSIIPAHIMRSVGGGYDNESVAITAMLMTFYFWVRSVRGGNSWIIGVLAGLAEYYMALSWGGYVFVVNMVALHAAVLSLTYVMRKEFDLTLHKAYSLFYVIGTYGATTVPVIGMTPLKSLEQMLPLLVFLAMQVVAVIEYQRREKNLTFEDVHKLRIQYFGTCAAAGVAVCAVLFPMGYFGPLSSRVRGLFVAHTRTGNPLVDSVAEHQPASPKAYWTYMHYACPMAPFGLALLFMKHKSHRNAMMFMVSYAVTVYYFSTKMQRLVLLAGPAAAVLAGVFIQNMFQLGVDAAFQHEDAAELVGKARRGKKGSLWEALSGLRVIWYQNALPRLAVSVLFVLWGALSLSGEFYGLAHHMAHGMSHPQIVTKGQMPSGETVVIDDYREAYYWLRDNTPKDARVLAWWDYGYQIAGLANRTTIADGNTWNHEHIALLGKALTSPQKDGHRIVRHLADYVLVWAGGRGDDMAKSPHMARIGTSVYKDVCPGDPSCSQFGMDHQGNPSPMMEKSLLYTLHSHKLKPGIEADENRFVEVMKSKYGKVRIFKVKGVDNESKKWAADPANRKCDAPGSWYCVGQYPPALQTLVDQGKAFAQLEDFNAKKD